MPFQSVTVNLKIGRIPEVRNSTKQGNRLLNRTHCVRTVAQGQYVWKSYRPHMRGSVYSSQTLNSCFNKKTVRLYPAGRKFGTRTAHVLLNLRSPVTSVDAFCTQCFGIAKPSAEPWRHGRIWSIWWVILVTAHVSHYRILSTRYSWSTLGTLGRR